MKKYSFLPKLLFLLLMVNNLRAQVKTVSSDIDWTSQQALVRNATEADFIIRVGDVDNLGFGWPEGFDPFCGRMTETHPFPWELNTLDLPGFDRILLSSKYNQNNQKGCGADGYSNAFDKVKCKPVAWIIPTDILKGATIQNAWF